MAQRLAKIFQPQLLIIAAAIVVIALIGLSVSVSRSVAPKDLRVVFLDVGQGDAILIEFPSGSRWLIDGGPDERVVSELDYFMSLANRRLAGIILTHPHADHVTGLIHILRRYQVERALLSSAIHTTPEYLTFLKELRARNIRSIPADHPFAWSGTDNGVAWRWEFLYPDRKLPDTVQNLNDVSVVSRLTFGEQSFLFMGDASIEIEKLLLAEGRDLKSSVLKIGHHGSASSSGDDFIQAVNPKYAVILVGEGNQFGHPAPETIDRLSSDKINIYRTDKNGWIQFRTDGKTLTVSSAR
ncbi:hypothetical protein A3H10_04300 [Candidatus Uhrbacteria bacterium RIFCSPLOWO2_12_FULL_46_10]|uniref:Metallo-beta-lactamase domain-containing protein n=1 Tax=Candidatus Uhrbacteria bacterium RIFCSPLOWO2_01_FULL_47_25 TaxID=1802402 RepID=A0A1F7USH4_9BACT|nr:MAG: Beta-lactamase domain protein [Parcubacteria group bacterium GW2011_GWA2_46_9]OGL60865.1 MAG: hypothetical protein A2752_00455 [Candidatus Uhrbacteria bacterium RIFCSPHIGHO2_01_FULL_46_23]OGL69916.1 MAG: hypothetical protein A3D60_00035 [Candidatus Uhrbacteria bacterium RIFCSPHIGHO2_02_FULL_47_29]OGL75760.1 MAG: hypothetical protein A3E96_00030 [Candidatus Uhrbacteria bacterium RIFCSPHIGHO2_12_FULL_46_13]OGL81241.1 MAG: hypothetical protein A2936_03005 [Candidatus Uhrbacteria bacterium 